MVRKSMQRILLADLMVDGKSKTGKGTTKVSNVFNVQSPNVHKSVSINMDVHITCAEYLAVKSN